MKPTIQKDTLRAQYAMIWGADSRMTTYCTNRTAHIAELPTGEMIAISKRSIETRFCYGESGYDYDDALRAAENARTNADHFRRENLRWHDDTIAWLRSALAASDLTTADYPRCMLTICKETESQPDACRLARIEWFQLTAILDACGGSARLDDLPGAKLRIQGIECRIATREEVRSILTAYEAARAAHEKKINSYLKRYGTTKVTAWTYWRDA